MLSDRKSITAYGSMGYDLGGGTELFADLQFSYSKLKLFRRVKSWYYVSPDGNEEGTFFNPTWRPTRPTAGCSSTTGPASSRPRRWAVSRTA